MWKGATLVLGPQALLTDVVKNQRDWFPHPLPSKDKIATL